MARPVSFSLVKAAVRSGGEGERKASRWVGSGGVEWAVMHGDCVLLLPRRAGAKRAKTRGGGRRWSFCVQQSVDARARF
jgi:hypothetical protein